MNAETIRCPACRNDLRLPPSLELLKAVHQGGGSYVAFGDPDRVLPCLYCGAGMRVRDILDGRYDAPRPSGVLSVLLGLGLVAGLLALLRFF